MDGRSGLSRRVYRLCVPLRDECDYIRDDALGFGRALRRPFFQLSTLLILLSRLSLSRRTIVRSMSKEHSELQPTNREFFIRRWTQEYAAFLDVFKALPPARLEYRPHPDSRSAGELVAMLVSVEQSCLELCSDRKTSYASGLRWHTPSGSRTLEEMIAAYQEHHRALAHKLNSLDDATWNHQAWLIRGEQEIILKDT